MKKCEHCQKLKNKSEFYLNQDSCIQCESEQRTLKFWSEKGVKLFRGIKDYKFWRLTNGNSKAKSIAKN